MRDLLLIVGLVALLLVESLGSVLKTDRADTRDPDATMLEEFAGIGTHESASSPVSDLFSLLRRPSDVLTGMSSPDEPGPPATSGRTSVVNVIDQTPRTIGQQTSGLTQKPPSASFAR